MIGVEDKEVGYGLPFNEYSQVKAMITHIGYPQKYLDAIALRNDVAKEKAEALMKKFIPEQPKYSEGGLSFELTLIEVNGEPVNELYSQNIMHLPTPQVWTKCKESYAKGNAYGYSVQQNGFSSKKTRAGQVMVIKLHPDSNISKDWNTNIVANNIPIGCEDAYRELIEKEQQRITAWEDVCKLWHGVEEEIALADIYEGFARRFGIMTPDDDKNYKILTPTVGMVIDGRLAIAKGKYWNVEVFAYDKVAKKYEVFCTLDVNEPSPKQQLMAKELHEKIENKKKAFADKKLAEAAEAKAAQSEDVLEIDDMEEVPF